MTTSLQNIILKLHHYWSDYGCVILQPYDVEVGAGTFHWATTLRALGNKHWKTAYVQPSRRPTDGRYGENPNRLQQYYQYQVLLKPSPKDSQDLFLQSLDAVGIDTKRHDIRFVEDNWESPTLGAWGLGWEIWCDGMEISQFTYFQQVAGMDCVPVSTEFTYGLERLAMFVQGIDNIFALDYGGDMRYRDVHGENERQFSRYNFELADTDMLTRHFKDCEDNVNRLCEENCPLPAYDYCLKASHLFNMLDARKALSVTERQAYITRVRNLSLLCGKTYIAIEESA